jgi:hypothetical protein
LSPASEHILYNNFQIWYHIQVGVTKILFRWKTYSIELANYADTLYPSYNILCRILLTGAFTRKSFWDYPIFKIGGRIAECYSRYRTGSPDLQEFANARLQICLRASRAMYRIGVLLIHIEPTGTCVKLMHAGNTAVAVGETV